MTDEAKLVRKLNRYPAAILTDRDVAIFVASAQRIWRGELLGVAAAENLGSRVEDVIRWGSVGMRCSQARSMAELGLNEAAKAVGIPRYRADAIESGQLGSFSPELAWRYFEFLGITNWVRRWARANRDLAARAGLAYGLPKTEA